MYRNRDIIGRKIIDYKGKYLGGVEDLLIDINNNCIAGVYVKKNSLRKKYFSVLKENITYLGERIIITKTNKDNLFRFKDIKSMEVLDLKGDILGTVESLIFSKEDFKIISFVISEGFIRNYIKGKRIILIKDLIIGDKNILFVSENNYYFYSKIHGVVRDE